MYQKGNTSKKLKSEQKMKKNKQTYNN